MRRATLARRRRRRPGEVARGRRPRTSPRRRGGRGVRARSGTAAKRVEVAPVGGDRVRAQAALVARGSRGTPRPPGRRDGAAGPAGGAVTRGSAAAHAAVAAAAPHAARAAAGRPRRAARPADTRPRRVDVLEAGAEVDARQPAGVEDVDVGAAAARRRGAARGRLARAPRGDAHRQGAVRRVRDSRGTPRARRPRRRRRLGRRPAATASTICADLRGQLVARRGCAPRPRCAALGHDVDRACRR